MLTMAIATGKKAVNVNPLELYRPLLGNPSNDIDRDEAGCTFRELEELSDLGLIGVIGDHRV